MHRENGILVGIVTDLDDPEKLGRVRVRLPHLADAVSDWCRIVTPLGGKDRGWFLRPEKDDEVLLACEFTDPRRIHVIGGMWSKVDLPPADDGKKTDNNWRFFRSRSGHMLKFDDTSGAERIEITGKGGKQQIVIDVSGTKIQVTCSSGDIELSAPDGKLSINAKTVEIKSSKTMTIQAGDSMTVKGQTVAIN
jgi:uncharacterized protein involved in type VI secretion and phage assembly